MKNKILLILFLHSIVLQVYSQCWYDTLGVSNLVDSLSTHFPTICKKEVIGHTVLGRAIVALKISDNVVEDEAEPEILLQGCIHGSEQTGTWMLCNLARELCKQYSSNYTIGNLVNKREIWIIPIINWDGYVGEPGWGPLRPNANFVELNRDAGYLWTGYFGNSPGPFSQPESKVMRDFILSRNFNMMIDYHSGLQGIIYPWFYRNDLCPDHNEFTFLANEYDIQSSYPPGQFAVTSGYDLYQTNGSLVEFAYGSLGISAFSVELFNGTSGDGCLGLEYNRASILMMIEKSGLGIQGNVTDANTGKPIEARITVQGKMPFFNSPILGDYHKFLKAGTYTVHISANGYDSKTINNVVVPVAGYAMLDVQLLPNISNKGVHKVIVVKNILDNQVAADPCITWNTPGMPDGQYYAIGDTGYVVLDIGSIITNITGTYITVNGSSFGVGNGYDLFCSTSSDGPWSLLGSGSTTKSFDLGNLSNIRYLKVKDNGNGPTNVIGAGFHLDAITVSQPLVGLDEHETEISAYQIYPNPSYGIINIGSTLRDHEGCTIRIADISGKSVYIAKMLFSDGMIKKLDVSYLNKGIYFVQFLGKSNTKTIKLVIQ